MTRFESRTSGVRSDRSTNCATTTGRECNVNSSNWSYENIELLGHEGDVAPEVVEVANQVKVETAERTGVGLRHEVDVWKRFVHFAL